MKGLLLAVLPILCNVLLSQGQNNNDNSLATDYPMGSEVTQNISFNSILEDINNFYNKNVKYQVVANNDETKETSGDANANGNNNTVNNNSNANGNANTNANGNNNNNANNNSNANGNSNTNNSNNNTNNNTGNNNTNGNTNNNSNGNANNNNNNAKGGNANANGNTKTDGTGDDEEPVKETGCGSDRASLGMFAFHKPIKRSILVINSNFTIIWSYNNILEGYEYNYPQNDVTIKLFYEDDANPNNWSNAWKSPVFEKVIPFSEIEDGPVINGIRTFQYNWLINPKVDKSFKMSPKSSEKYKLRIYGDGKDVQSNSANFQCYSDGDIQPGLTVAFYIVDNTYIDKKYYKPLPIEDKSAGVQSKASLMMTFVIAIFLILYNY